MKKLLALMLAAALALSLVACGGGGGAGDNNTPSTPIGGNGDTTSTDTPSGGGEDSTPDETSEPQGLAIGETAATDKVEFVLKEFEFADHLYLDTRDPDRFLLPLTEEEVGALEGNEQYSNPDPGKAIAFMSFTVKNIGKTPLHDFVDLPSGESTIHVNGYVEIDYDGYLFRGSDNGVIVDCEAELDPSITVMGWSSTLELNVLEPAHTYKGYIGVPEEVKTNTDKPLRINVYLPNENGEFDTFTYSIR